MSLFIFASMFSHRKQQIIATPYQLSVLRLPPDANKKTHTEAQTRKCSYFQPMCITPLKRISRRRQNFRRDTRNRLESGRPKWKSS